MTSEISEGSRPFAAISSKIAFSQPATPVSISVIVVPYTWNAYTNRSSVMPGATGTLNGSLSAWTWGVTCMG
jgi:hypothetical protein